jgi:hypothetical protein
MQDSKSMTQPDELIDFHHLKSRRGLTQLELEDEVATDLQKATGLVDSHSSNAANLNRVLQLTGAPAACISPAFVRPQCSAFAPLSSALFSGSKARACVRFKVRCKHGERIILLMWIKAW